MEIVWRDISVLQAPFLQILLRTAEIGRIAPAVATHCAHGDFSVPQAQRLLYPVHMDIFFRMREAPISRAANFALLDPNAKLALSKRLLVLLVNIVLTAIFRKRANQVLTKKSLASLILPALRVQLAIGVNRLAFRLYHRLNVQWAIIVLLEPFDLRLVPMEPSGTFQVLRHYPIALRAFLGKYVRATPRQYLSMFLLANHLASLLVFLVPLGTFATGLL